MGLMERGGSNHKVCLVNLHQRRGFEYANHRLPCHVYRSLVASPLREPEVEP